MSFNYQKNWLNRFLLRSVVFLGDESYRLVENFCTQLLEEILPPRNEEREVHNFELNWICEICSYN